MSNKATPSHGHKVVTSRPLAAVHTHNRILRAFANFGRDERLVRENLLHNIEPPRIPKARRSRGACYTRWTARHLHSRQHQHRHDRRGCEHVNSRGRHDTRAR